MEILLNITYWVYKVFSLEMIWAKAESRSGIVLVRRPKEQNPKESASESLLNLFDCKFI